VRFQSLRKFRQTVRLFFTLLPLSSKGFCAQAQKRFSATPTPSTPGAYKALDVLTALQLSNETVRKTFLSRGPHFSCVSVIFEDNKQCCQTPRIMDGTDDGTVFYIITGICVRNFHQRYRQILGSITHNVLTVYDVLPTRTRVCAAHPYSIILYLNHFRFFPVLFLEHLFLFPI
jgi:hypothetical protein